MTQQPTVIPTQDSLIITDDLLSLSLGGPTMSNVPTQQSSNGMDLLGDGLDSLVSYTSPSSALQSKSCYIIHNYIITLRMQYVPGLKSEL